ncbi:sigma-70 family RNA polymerase sigma factor [Isoptericola halotolerans]|uniref:RNA polymerase sigma-70 factor (ECF subfamily) n=1 Tax=Isoptericola halotolerans TaxID=300560 RepID=A0ABX1ZZ76_9MICO|nr:RNA polymerase sigma factor [Isoptericola halotolerans]NOV95854.1 RNA polymerase sigma-70 factor (ECF subfamily) [Isoptericola halotolerans]
MRGDGMLDGLARALEGADPATARRIAFEAADDDALATLARYAADGDELAVELLVELLDDSGVVRRFVRAALLDENDVDDVSQDVLISVATSIHGFAGTSRVTTWVHSIVRRRVVDHLRRRRATTSLPDDDIGPGERMSSMLATRASVRDALSGLPEIYRAPVALRDIDGLTYAQVAERLCRPVGTVKAQVSRGRALVAARLGEM